MNIDHAWDHDATAGVDDRCIPRDFLQGADVGYLGAFDHNKAVADLSFVSSENLARPDSEHRFFRRLILVFLGFSAVDGLPVDERSVYCRREISAGAIVIAARASSGARP